MHLIFPILHKAGRVTPFTYDLTYDTSIWFPVTSSGVTQWQHGLSLNWNADTAALTGHTTATETLTSLGTPCVDTYTDTWANYNYHEPLGRIIPFAMSTYVTYDSSSLCNGSNTASGPATLTSSGYSMTADLGTVSSIISPTGASISGPVNNQTGAGTFTDANGNQLSTNSSRQLFDTLSSTTPALTVAGGTSTGRTYTYTDTSNTARSVTFTYTTYTLQTAFGCSGISEYGPVSTPLVTSISYPDGTGYSFTYEPTPGVSGAVTGRLASITLPQGGVIDYAYSGGSQGIVCADGGAATLTRSLPNDPLTPSMTYTRTPGTYTSHTDVVDGLSNHSSYDFVSDPADPLNTPYTISHIQYQGAATGTPLLSEQSCLNGATPPCTTQTLALPISSITTTSQFNGSTTKKSMLTFNGNGLLTDDQEYDFGSGSAGSLLSDSSYTYNSSLGTIVDHLSNISIADGSSHITQSVYYGYDAATPTATTGLPQHVSVTTPRGNLTSVKYDTILATRRLWRSN